MEIVLDVPIEPGEHLDEADADDLSIAIIGIAGRLPGADDLDAFWQSLVAGKELITHFSREELEEAGVPPALLADPHYVKSSPILERNPGLFDAAFFGYTPREARITDPQHRLFLECAWEALEHAGYDADRCDVPVGVFGGCAMNTYFMYSGLIPDFYDEYFPILLGNDNSYLATRVSFKLNLTGPSMTLQTACSSSLVAVHIACQSLLNEECDLALAGGVSVRVPHKIGYRYQEGSVASPDGHCRAFDTKAAGTLFGSGAGVVVLKRLTDAIADGDSITAVIKGTAVNNDGASKLDFTAPSVGAQAEVISQALASAGVSADTISYVEAHGTGTYLGDPIEVAALTRAFRKDTDRSNYCALGSVKTNIGHLDAAAGVVGLIKVALSLSHKQIPASLHFQEPNPQIDFAGSPFFVNAETSPWPSTPGLPRRAGLSSLGIGGTNAHAVLEEAPSRVASSASRGWQLLLLSARSEAALKTAASNLARHLENEPDLPLADVAYTLQVGRKRFDHRRMVICSDRDEAVAILEGRNPGGASGQVRKEEPSIAFMFPGGGVQYCNMALDLYQQEEVFREEVERCFSLIAPDLASHLRGLVYPNGSPSAEIIADLEKPSNALVGLFAIEYALAKLLMSWGVRPSAMIGHSVGEYAAACLAGVFSLEDALALVALRGRLFETLPEGSMVSVPLSPEEVRGIMSEDLSIAAVNRTNLCVVSGPPAAVEALRAMLAAREIDTARIHISVAAHSKLVEPILDEFRAFIQGLDLGTPEIPLVSNLTGDFIEPERVTDPDYWVRHLRETVHFADGIGQLVRDPRRALIEVGPGQTLATLARQHPDKSAGQVIACTTRHPREDTPDYAVLLNTLGRLWLAGSEIDWGSFYAGERRCRVPLPAYPFERQLFWREELVEDLRLAQGRQRSTTTRREEPATEAADASIEGPKLDPLPGAASGDTPLLIRLKRMLHEISGVEMADLDANATFTELGIDSLMLTQVASALGRDFDFKIGPRELFQETPSLALLAAHMEKEFPEKWGAVSAQGGDSLRQDQGPAEMDGMATPSLPGQVVLAKLKSIIEEITGHDAATIDPGATFIELGIDSLMMSQVSARIRKEFGVALDLKDLLGTAPTLNALADYITKRSPPVATAARLPDTPRDWTSASRAAASVRDDGPHVAREADIADWFYVPSWKRSALAPTEIERQSTPWLLFADDLGLCVRLAQTLEARGETVVTVTCGTRFERQGDNHFRIRQDARDDYVSLFSALSQADKLPTRIVHAWSHTPEMSNGADAEELDIQGAGFFSLLYLAQALGTAAAGADIRMFILTNDLFAMNGSEPINPLKATLLGPCRVIPKEMPELQCRLIDLPTHGPRSSDEDLVATLLTEFGQGTAEQVVAYRDGERWVQTFSPVHLTSAEEANGASAPLKKSGVYLITGGQGDVGAVIADYLAREFQARLVLVGRTELPRREEWGSWLKSQNPDDAIGRKIRQVRELENLGSEVLTVSADVADHRQIDSAIQQGIERFGCLNGIIHAAGILKDGIIQFRDRRDVEASFAAKITGTLNIEAATRDLDLDFVALFSSTHSILAPPGQVAHSAANSYLDQFAQSRRNRGCRRFLTINWPVWTDVSLLDTEAGDAWLDQARASGIRLQEGVEVFRRVLGSQLPQVIVSPKNFLENLNVFTDLANSAPSQSDQWGESVPSRRPLAQQQSQRRSTKVHERHPFVREVTNDDIDEIISLLGEGFPAVTSDHWRRIFDYSWDPRKPNLGFVLVDGEDLVGFVGTIYADREIDGQRERFCSGSAWFVRPAYRAHSMDLLLTFVAQPGYTITALTPNPVSGPVLEAMGFQVLERAIRLLPPLLQAHTLLRSAGLRVLTTPEEIKPHLSEADLKILRDHGPYACRHYLALSEEGSCYIVTRNRAIYGIRFSEILYASDPAVMVRHLEWIKLRILVSERALCLMSDERMFGGHCPLSLRRSRLRYFMSDTLNASQIDHLYTEFVVVPDTGRGRLGRSNAARYRARPSGDTVAKREEIEMPVYAVAQGRIENRDMLNQYVAKVIPTIQACGGRILGFDESPEIVEGEIEHPRTVILEFPSREAFHAWYDSAEYQEILPLRLESTPSTLIVVNGLA